MLRIPQLHNHSDRSQSFSAYKMYKHVGGHFDAVFFIVKIIVKNGGEIRNKLNGDLFYVYI